MSETFFDVETWLDTPDKTVAFVVLNGVGKQVINHRSDMTYEVVSGRGIFYLSGHGREVHEGDRIMISKGNIYQDEGDLAMLATSEPSFDPNAVEVLEQPVREDAVPSQW